MPDPWRASESPRAESRDWSREIRARLAPLRLSPARELEIVEELSQHLEDRWQELVAGGVAPDEATRAALAEFSGADALAKRMATLRQARASVSPVPGAPARHLLAALSHDLRYAARALWKERGFSSVAIVTLALGIGATTAIFSVVYGVILKPLPFDEPDRLVGLYHHAPGFGTPRLPQSNATYFTYRDHAQVFEDIGLWRTDKVSIARGDTPESEQALRLTDGMLTVLRVRPLLGDLLRKADDVPGAPNRVLLTYGYWQRAFGAARDIVGRPLVIDGSSYDIAGVLPASFKFLDTRASVLLPLKPNRARALTGPGFGDRAVARLKPGVTLAQANDDIGRMIPLIPQQFPLQTGVTQEMWDGVGLSPNVRPFSEDAIGDIGRSLWILLGTVGFVLLMAWANVANLLLVRAEGRQQEFAVRAALGASRGRIAAALLSETLLLGLAGGALGVVFAQAGVGLLRRIAPVQLPRVDDVAIDGVVLLFTLTLSVVTPLVFGMFPAARLGTINVDALKDAGRSAGEAPGRQHRTRNMLVVAQVALALVLLIVSGLMIRTFVAMRQVQPGYVRPAEVQTFQIRLPPALIRDSKQVVRTHEEIAERLTHVPGVAAVGLARSIPMGGFSGAAPISVEGRPVSGTPPTRRVKPIGPGYFETMGNAVVAGRAITWADVHQTTAVTMISENLAREYWGEPSNALRKRLGGGDDWSEIVGVVGNERLDGLNRPAPAIVYFAANEGWMSRDMAYVVRSPRVGASGFLRELQQAVSSVNPNLPLATVRTLSEIEADSMAPTAFAMVMLAIAAGAALVLGLVGIYGVIQYIAVQRTREIGIRVALGAQTADVRRLFLRHGVVLTGCGVAVGVGAAVLLTRVMTALLFGVAPTDPATYVAASAGLAAVALVATYLPARRASRIDPIVALRSRPSVV
jgi:putative ABC transport system permease protein